MKTRTSLQKCAFKLQGLVALRWKLAVIFYVKLLFNSGNQSQDMNKTFLLLVASFIVVVTEW